VRPASPTISDVLERFLARSETTPDDEAVVDLLRSYLDGYGHQMLAAEDAAFFQERGDQDEEAGAFCDLFGPEYILEGLHEFLGWFVIRKVMAGPELTATFGPVAAELVRWLVSQDIVSAEAADGASELTREAAADLPAAEELGTLLYDAGTDVDHDAVLEYVDWESELAEISRVEPGKLWFRSELGEIGPVIVPPRASEIARLGWGLSAPGFGRTEAGWHVLEMGNVYPT
jgi:hypothetical protein